MLAEEDNQYPPPAGSFSLASDIVELVVHTTDDAFLQTLRDAVGSSRRLWHVPAASQVSDLLLAGQVGILVLDVPSQPEAAGTFVSHLKRQFPDLVILVAGHREAEAALAPFISDGTVYRFIHKPMSPERARLFAEAAVKRHSDQQRHTTAPQPTPRRTVAGSRIALLGAAAGAVVVAAVGSLWLIRHGQGAGASTSPAPQERRAAVAEEATAPQPGPAEQRERLLAQAESALLEERVDDAAKALEGARALGADAGRTTFLAAQLAKLRNRPRRQQVATRAPADAAPTIPESPDSPLSQALALAAQRIGEGRLADPPADSAKHYVQAALALDPNGNATQAAAETLAKAMLQQIRAALDARDWSRAGALIEAADGIAAPANIEIVREAREAAMRREKDDSQSALRTHFAERLRQDRLVEPAGDSAKFFLAQLRATDAAAADLEPLAADFGARLVAKARHELEEQHLEAAQHWLDEIAAAGYSSADSAAVRRDFEAALDQRQRLAQPIDASELTLVKSVQPSYPVGAARTNTQGWVELDFTVTESGGVTDVAVHAADPPGVFDAAAIGALSRWRYQPVLRGSKAVAQRARIRIRFTLAG